MIKRIVPIALVIVAFAASARLASAADKHYQLYYLDERYALKNVPNWRNFDAWRKVHLDDGDVVVEITGAHPDARDPAVKPDHMAHVAFSFDRTKAGTLIRMHLSTRFAQNYTEKSRQLDDLYLTADFSGKEPAIKFTKEPEKGSYWNAPPVDRAAPISIKNESGQELYLSHEDKLIPLKPGVGAGTAWNVSRIALSSKPATFCITNEDLNDGGL